MRDFEPIKVSPGVIVMKHKLKRVLKTIGAVFAALVITAITVSCISDRFDKIQIEESIKDLKSADPKSDAKAALDKKEHMIYMVWGDIASFIPGIKSANYNACVASFGVKELKTFNILSRTFDFQLSELSYNYALEYNRIIFSDGPKLNPKLRTDCAEDSPLPTKEPSH